MQFTKTKEDVIRSGTWSFFLMRELKCSEKLSNFSQDEILSAVMKSKFHIWQGEVIAEHDLKLNTYGYYDNSKLISSDYVSIDFNFFKIKLLSIVNEWNKNEKGFTENVEILINENLNPNACYFFLEPGSDKIAQFHTYTFFCGCIIIDRETDTATLIELGQD